MWRLEAKSRGTQVSMIAPPRATNMEEHDESVEEVAVDAIVSHKLNVAENRVEYLIQWSENGKRTYTWEPEENAVDADDLIYQYWCEKQGSSHAAALDNVNAARRIAPRSNLAEDQAPPSLPPLSEARPAARLPPPSVFFSAGETRIAAHQPETVQCPLHLQIFTIQDTIWTVRKILIL